MGIIDIIGNTLCEYSLGLMFENLRKRAHLFPVPVFSLTSLPFSHRLIPLLISPLFSSLPRRKVTPLNPASGLGNAISSSRGSRQRPGRKAILEYLERRICKLLQEFRFFLCPQFVPKFALLNRLWKMCGAGSPPMSIFRCFRGNTLPLHQYCCH